MELKNYILCGNFTENLIEYLPYYVYIIDIEGNIVLSNNKGKRIIESIITGEMTNIKSLLQEWEFYFCNDKKIEPEESPIFKALSYGERTYELTIYTFVGNIRKYITLSIEPIKENGIIKGALITFHFTNTEFVDSLKLDDERNKFLLISTELKKQCDIIEVLRKKEIEHIIYLKGVINNISEGILVLDSNNGLSLYNKAAYNILNLNQIDLLDERKVLKKYIIIDLQENKKITNNFFKEYSREHVQVKNKILKFTDRENNEVKYIELNVVPILNKNDKLVNTIITLKDVTESKLHQISAEEQAKFVKDVVNTIDAPIAVIDYPDLNIQLLNKECEKILGYFNKKFPSNMLIGRNAANFIPESYKQDFCRTMTSAGKNNREITYPPFRIKDLKGNERYYKVKIVPYKTNNRKNRIHIHGYDVTEEVNHSLELEKITKLKDEFFTIISHELRTPLTIIYSSLQLAYDVYFREITPNIDKTLGRINQNCSRLLKLINNILDISKAEAGFLSLSPVDFDLINLSETIVSSVNSFAKSKNISLIFDTNEEECIVRLDMDKYEKILLNLLSNAIKFTPEGKCIFVTLSIEDEYFSLSVEDQGIGIPKNKIDSIFDRFVQVNNSLTRRAEGTGVGLALVKKIVELMNAEIKVNSKVQKGTEFLVKFKKTYGDASNIKNYAVINSDNINGRINIEFSDIN